MNAVITEKVRVDARHATGITDPRLVPGEEIEVVSECGEVTEFQIEQARRPVALPV